MTPEEKLIVERLKATIADVDEMEKVFTIVTKTLALREAEIEQLKALLARAADALERIEVCQHWQWTIDLAKELREGAR